MDADLGNDDQLILMAPQECLHVSGPPSHLLSAFGADAQPGPGDEKLKGAATAQNFSYFKNDIWTHLQVSQRWCPFLHWKIRLGGAISSKHTCVIIIIIVTIL